MAGNASNDDAKRLKAVWDQGNIPVVLRRVGKGERIRVRLPFASSNGAWLRNDRHIKPEWFGGKQKYWELPKAWFNDFVERALKKYGKLYVIQPYREQEVCARSCMEATGHDLPMLVHGRKSWLRVPRWLVRGIGYLRHVLA
jgi:hypothetical protein